MELEKLWDKALTDIELEISRPNYVTWFKNSQLVDKKDGVVIIGLPNNFVKGWVENNYYKLILGTLRSIDNSIKKLEFVVVPKKPVVNLASQINENLPQQPFEEFKIDQETNLNPQLTFQSFAVGSSNELAHAAATAVVNSLGNKYNPLLIYGGVGVGKTHLAQAIGNEVKNKYRGKVKVRYVPSEKFTNDVIWSIRNKRTESIKSRYRNVDLLIIDDIQFIGGKTATEEEFFHTFEALKGQNKQIVVTSDKPPARLPHLEERLRSRLEAGMTVDIGYPDFELKVAVLQTKLGMKKIQLSDEIINYIASKTPKNLRELEGILNKVLFYKEFKNIEINKKIIDQIVDNVIIQPTKNINPNKVIQCVANYFEVSPSDLTGKSRKQEFVEPRQITIYLLRELLGLSYPYIADKLGKRDHTTAIYAYEKIKRCLQEDSRLNQKILVIKELIESE